VIKTEKTIYDKPEASDGKRILVMRLWPRGVSKAKVDVWLKELGTKKELIKRWKSGEISWREFERDYKKSLIGKEELLRSLAEEARKNDITLLCVEKDEARCHRSLLKLAIERYAQG